MADNRYEKLERMRTEIRRDKAKVAKMQEQIKQKEAKLREAENTQIVADVSAMNMSPEQLGSFLKLIQSGKLSAFMTGQSANNTVINEQTEETEDNEDEEN